MEAQLEAIDFAPSSYLRQARRRAKAHGYDPKNIEFSDRPDYKLMTIEPRRHFGRVGYGDFLIWSFLEKKGHSPKGTAKDKQERFLASHSKIKGKWRDDDFSPNNLAMRILW